MPSAMNKPLDPHWRNLVTRRSLSPAESAEVARWLAAHPEALAGWTAEVRLTEVLRNLPAPVIPSSNFTAQVLAAVDRLPTAERPSPFSWVRRWLVWHPGWQVATAVGVLGLGLVVHQHQRAEFRRQLAREVSALPLAALADADFWRDFEPIHALPTEPVPSADELAAAFQ